MFILVSKSLDPYRNLAVEDYLVDRAHALAPALFLWRGRCSVVIGKHQNPWRECRLPALRAAGGALVRRVSGGGAVYHDEGNLNYAFLCHRASFDKDVQYAVVCRALAGLGIDTGRMGKSSLGVRGKKISGNAFCYRRKGVLHHGTLLVSAQLARIGEFLKGRDPSFETHAVVSEPAPVANLCDFVPGLTVEQVGEALAAAFEEHCGGGVERRGLEALDTQDIAEREARMRTWDWCFGRTPSFTVPVTETSSWGTVSICFHVEKGRVAAAAVSSEELTAAAAASLENALCGCRFESGEMSQAVRTADGSPAHITGAVAEWLLEEGY